MKSSDTVTIRGTFDPLKAYQSLARIIGDRYGVEITVKSVKKESEPKEKAG